MFNKVINAKPTGSRILVEMLTAKEISGSSLVIKDDTDVGSCPQAIVLAIGPTLVDHQLNIGDRVLVTGKYAPVPNFGSSRYKGIVEFNDIKAILIEE